MPVIISYLHHTCTRRKMSNARFLIPSLFLPILLLGCGSVPPSPPHAQQAKTYMVGMSRDEMGVCLGLPAKRVEQGLIETWSYIYGDCTANLTVADGRVKSVSYTIKKYDTSTPSEEVHTEDEQCEHVPVLVSCLRWQRDQEMR
jgi:hypothetical protein